MHICRRSSRLCSSNVSATRVRVVEGVEQQSDSKKSILMLVSKHYYTMLIFIQFYKYKISAAETFGFLAPNQKKNLSINKKNEKGFNRSNITSLIYLVRLLESSGGIQENERLRRSRPLRLYEAWRPLKAAVAFQLP